MKQKLLNSKLKQDITRIFCSANYWNGSKELDCDYYSFKVEKERAVILCLVLPQVDPFASGVQRSHPLIPFTNIEKKIQTRPSIWPGQDYSKQILELVRCPSLFILSNNSLMYINDEVKNITFGTLEEIRELCSSGCTINSFLARLNSPLRTKVP